MIVGQEAVKTRLELAKNRRPQYPILLILRALALTGQNQHIVVTEIVGVSNFSGHLWPVPRWMRRRSHLPGAEEP